MIAPVLVGRQPHCRNLGSVGGRAAAGGPAVPFWVLGWGLSLPLGWLFPACGDPAPRLRADHAISRGRRAPRMRRRRARRREVSQRSECRWWKRLPGAAIGRAAPEILGGSGYRCGKSLPECGERRTAAGGLGAYWAIAAAGFGLSRDGLWARGFSRNATGAGGRDYFGASSASGGRVSCRRRG
jgi:hypothetical protein